MNGKERDVNILKRIINYCDEINEAKDFFGNSYEIFEQNKFYRNTVSLSMLQIGELSNHLTESFRENFKEVPWRDIRGMRNIVAHGYDKVSKKVLWQTCIDDIPNLNIFCKNVLEQYYNLDNDLSEEEENTFEDEYDLEP